VGHGKRLAKGKASESARSSYLEVHPNASYYVDFKDFHFWRMQVESIRYIGGYGRMSWVPADEWNTATADPIAGAERRIIDHMNADHADTMALYCQAFSQAKNAEHVRLSSVDRYGFEMSVKTEHGPRPVRLAFESEVVNAHDVRKEMVAMAKKARATLGK
jgi:putative heme iron utilization protein